MLRRFFLAVVIISVSLIPCGSLSEKARLSNVGFYFDTVVTLSVYSDGMEVINKALEQCAKYEAMLSKTVEGSDVWNINHAQGKPVTVSDDTISVLNTAISVSNLSGGAFDVTVAPEVALWDFTGGSNKLPDKNELSEAASKVDYTKISVDGNTVTLPEGMSLDLGGVAKGFIADRIAQFFRDNGVTSGILNFGGNVIALGQKPEGSWKVGIQNPQQPTGEYMMAISASDTAVVTSGVYERGFDIDGVRYHHILNPETGWPMQNELASVTIITRESALADALSTATFVLGLEKGVELINGIPEAEAIFITKENSIYATDGASAMIAG